MAEFMNPQEIADEMERLRKSLENGHITADEFNARMKDATIGVRGYTQNLRNSMAQLGTSFKALGKDIYDGKKGVGVFSNTMDTGASAVAAYALKFGPAGVALGAFTKAVTAFVTASLKQSDLLFDSYEKISRAGTVGAGAMSEVFDNMLKFGYTVNELNDLSELLARNSRNFGLFFKSALDGSRAFSEVANTIQNSPLREQFFRLGLGVTEINDGIAGFVNQQGKMGRVQTMTVEQLAKGAEAYIKELDVLTKLTGMTRKEQEDAREQALQIRQFYAGLADLGEKEAEEALKAFTMAYARGGPEAAAEMAADFNGVLTSAGKMFMATGGRSMEVFSKEFFERGGTAAESFSRLSASISPEFLEMTKNMNKLNSDMGSFDLRILTMLKGGPEMERFQKLMDKLTDEQYKQLTGMDRATAAQARARDNQIKTAQNLQEFVNMGVAPATTALQYFTEALEYLTSWIPGAGDAKRRREEEKAIREGKTTATQRMETAGRTAAGQLGFEGGAELTFEEQKKYGVGPTGAPAGGAGLTGKSLTGVTPALAQALQMAATEYNQITGKNVEVTSAVRDSAKQAELYQAYIEGRSKFPAAPPGTSKHERGLAVDIAETAANELDRLGLLQKYGLSRPVPNDPVHIEASAEMGGILSGPKSGYQAVLHGTEAVVPLPDGKNIPVEVRNQDSGMMSAQLDKLDELVRIMQAQVNVSTKILQAAV